jgi:acid phosphatase family membrane protein YuiD
MYAQLLFHLFLAASCSMVAAAVVPLSLSLLFLLQYDFSFLFSLVDMPSTCSMLCS